MITVKKVYSCRVCKNANLLRCIDIGNQYLSSIFPENTTYKKSLRKYPLSLVLCKKSRNTCGTLQLGHFINLDEMYKYYPYLSSTNSSMQLILKEVAESALRFVNLGRDDVILDIGGNDGTLLSFLVKTQSTMITIDPARNIRQVFKYPKFSYINEYFSKKVYDKSSSKKAKLIFSIAMFYHLSNPVEFSKDVASCLDKGGVWIIQMAYLPLMLKTNMYDNIVHEHAGYYTLHNMKWIIEQTDLEIFDCELNDVYGGSFRVYIKKRDNKNIKINRRVSQILADERKARVNNLKTYINFMKRINKAKRELLELLKSIKSRNKTTWIYGASTKGNTILQFCNIDQNLIVGAADSNPFKFGKFMIGSDIPIYDESVMRSEKPDYLLSLPYSFTNTFMEREAELIKSGTRFIVPLPEVKIIP